MRLLLDEMYPPALAERLKELGVEARTAFELGLAGRSDADVFATACEQGRAVLTENVADFERISAEHLTAGQHHPGLLIALSSRFSRRPSGIGRIVAAIQSVVAQNIEDRVIYLEDPSVRQGADPSVR